MNTSRMDKQTGVKALIRNNLTGKYLLLNRNLEKYPEYRSKGTLDIPGGRIQGEDHINELKREISEEIGLELDIKNIVELAEQIIENKVSNKIITRHTLLCTADVIEDEIKLSDEHSSYSWYSIEELLELSTEQLDDLIIEAIHTNEVAFREWENNPESFVENKLN